MKKQIKHIIKDILLKEEFDTGSAFNFIKQKEGRALPRKYVLSVLKSGNISELSIPEDLGDDEELHLIYKILYAPNTLTEEDLHVKWDLDLNGCASLQSLPQGLSVGKNLYLKGCTSLQSLPEGLSVGWWLDLEGCISLQSLPEGLSVGGALNLNGCTSLQSLPEGLSVGEGLYLQDCISLQKLPQELSVGSHGSLYLNGCTSLQSLPEGLSVGWCLGLEGCISLEKLPQGLSVVGILYFKKSDPIPQRFGGDEGAIRRYIEVELGGKVKGGIGIEE